MMTFVNEIVSEEDVMKYGLDGLMKEFNPFKWKSGRPSVFVHSWTIDREREIFLLPVKSIEEVGSSGRLEPTRSKVFLLIWQGRRVQITIDRLPGSSVNFSDVPFRIVWGLISIDATQFQDATSTKLIDLLKEALVVYGHRGAHQQVPNTVVEFEF